MFLRASQDIAGFVYGFGQVNLLHNTEKLWCIRAGATDLPYRVVHHNLAPGGVWVMNPSEMRAAAEPRGSRERRGNAATPLFRRRLQTVPRGRASRSADLLEQRQVGVAIGRETIALLKGAHRRANLVADLAVDLAGLIAQRLELCLQSSDLSFAQLRVVGRPLR